MFKSPESRVLLRAALVFIGGVLTSLVASTAGSDLSLNELLIAVASGFGLATGGTEMLSSTVNPTVGRQ